LLGILLAICLIGSLLPQNEELATYVEAYGETGGYLIKAFGFDRIFTMWYTAIIAVALCLNLVFCNLIQTRVLVTRWRDYKRGANSCPSKPAIRIKEAQKAEFIKNCKGFSFRADGADGAYGYRNRIGIWGAWVTHLGILILIVGFIITQISSYKSYTYGTETTISQIEGTNYQVCIDAFNVTYREDDTVAGYETRLSVLDENGAVLTSGSTRINHPFVYKGYRFYQNSTGYACELQVYENGELQASKEIYAGTAMTINALGVQIALNNLYPDYQAENGYPKSISPHLNNPYALYTIYYNGNILDMNVAAMGERLKFGTIEVAFANPKQYTMLEIRRDPALFVVLCGAIIIMLGLFFSFYFRTEEIWLRKNPEGDSDETQWLVFCRSPKAPLLLEEKVKELASDKEEANGFA
jgi:cytochrome c biogenesis protein ResB